MQKWAEYNRELAQASTSGRKGVAETPAGLALQRWSSVGKKGRAALRKANVHSVLQLETQILEFLELVGVGVG